MTKGRRIVVGAAVVGVAAVIGLSTRSRSAALEIDAAPAQRVAALQSFVTASGEIVAARYADIGSAVMGRLVDLPVKEGDTVRAGQVVARIDPVQASTSAEAASALLGAIEADARAAATQVRAAQATVTEMQARRAELAAALKRARELRDAGLLPAADFDAAATADAAAAAQVAAAVATLDRSQQAVTAAERRIAQAAAERTRARDALSKTEITAPIDGVVTRLDVEQGEMVVMGVQNQPGTILMTISDLTEVNAEIKVAEADVMRLRNGMSSSVAIEALPGQTFNGRVVEIGASALPAIGAQAAAREFRVRIRIDGAAAQLKPGLTCDADILAAEKRDVIAIPLQAVVDRDGKSGVYVIDGDAARFTEVQTGIIGGLSIEVTGLSEGARVITGPIQALRQLQDGTRVAVRTATRD